MLCMRMLLRILHLLVCASFELLLKQVVIQYFYANVFFMAIIFFNEVDIQVNILSLLYMSLAFFTLRFTCTYIFDQFFSKENWCTSETMLWTLIIISFSLTQYCVFSSTDIVIIDVLPVSTLTNLILSGSCLLHLKVTLKGYSSAMFWSLTAVTQPLLLTVDWFVLISAVFRCCSLVPFGVFILLKNS